MTLRVNSCTIGAIHGVSQFMTYGQFILFVHNYVSLAAGHYFSLRKVIKRTLLALRGINLKFHHTFNAIPNSAFRIPN